MDAKEVIEALNAGITEAKEHYERRKDEDDVTMIELFSVCVEALEKQVPKEPIQKEDSAYGWDLYCPNCGCFIVPSTYKHCPDCGQAIKNDKE